PYTTKFPISVLENYNLNNTDGLVAGNQDAADILRDNGYTGAVKVMPQLGVDEQLFSPQSQPELAEQLGLTAEEFIIGFIGRFVPEKGLLTLIKALTQIKHLPWKLLLLGRGELEAKILAEAELAGIRNRVNIIPSVPHEQVPEYINLMDTLVLPSQTTYEFKTLTAVGWKEQFGHVLIEAMACKVPVVGSDSGEIPNVIGEAGLVFPEQDATALSQCLSSLIEQPNFAKSLGEAGYERVMENYTNLALAKQQLDFYRELVNN
ncbi:MAG: glycosyltransferase, partial [Cyanobacteria bacterium J083]